MGRPRKGSKCKNTKRCKGRKRTSRKTKSGYSIPKAYACAGQRGPATTVMTTNSQFVCGRTFTRPEIINDLKRRAALKITNSNYMDFWNSVKNNPAAMRPLISPAPSARTTNATYGWSKQQVDDQQSSGLGYGPRPFRTG